MKVNILKKPCSDCPYLDTPTIFFEQLDLRAQDMEKLTLDELLAVGLGYCHKSSKNACWGHSERKRLQGKIIIKTLEQNDDKK